MLKEIVTLLFGLVTEQIRAIEDRKRRLCIALVLGLVAGLIGVAAAIALAAALFLVLTIEADLTASSSALITGLALLAVMVPVLLAARSQMR